MFHAAVRPPLQEAPGPGFFQALGAEHAFSFLGDPLYLIARSRPVSQRFIDQIEAFATEIDEILSKPKRG